MKFKPYVLLTIAIPSMSFSGCVQSDVAGPNGYSISCDKGRECAVIQYRPDDISVGTVVIQAEVDEYGIVGQYIIGHVVQQNFGPPPPPPPPPEQRQTPGFFIFDTLSGNKRTGLDKEAWIRELDRLRISERELKKTAYASDQNQPAP